MRLVVSFPKVGDIRIIRKFLFFSRFLNDGTMRWLEFITIKQEYVEDYPDGYKWIDLEIRIKN